MVPSTELQVAGDSGAGDCGVRKWVRTPWKAPEKTLEQLNLQEVELGEGLLTCRPLWWGKNNAFQKLPSYARLAPWLSPGAQESHDSNHILKQSAGCYRPMCPCSKAVRTPLTKNHIPLCRNSHAANVQVPKKEHEAKKLGNLQLPMYLQNLFLCYCWESILLCSLGLPLICYITQVDLKFGILLLQFLECWNC